MLITAEFRYHWLKLYDDFFGSKRIKKLRKLAGGDTYTIIYLKMQLKAIKSEGILKWTGLEDDFAAELALDLDESVDDVKITLNYLLSCGLAETSDGTNFFFPYAVANTGSETSAAKRMRDMRERNGSTPDAKALPRSDAERQRQYRAKQNCEKNHVPMIEDHMNKKRYNGNYYLVCQREKFRCAICGGTDNVCVHHIDGFSEEHPENSELNKMVLLCRECHQKVHRSGLKIPEEILDSIGYMDDVTKSVTPLLRDRYGDKEEDKEKEIELESEIDKEGECERGKSSTPDTKWTPEYMESLRERARKAYHGE